MCGEFKPGFGKYVDVCRTCKRSKETHGLSEEERKEREREEEERDVCQTTWRRRRKLLERTMRAKDE